LLEHVFEHCLMTTALRELPARAGVRPETGERPLPVLPPLAPLLPHGGLRRGSTVVVQESPALLLALLAGPSQAGSWCAVVGMPALGLVAAAEVGVALDRLPLVPAPGADWATVTAALLDALDLVVVAPARSRVRDGDARRLAARARQRGSVLVPFGVRAGGWEGADLWLTVGDARWEGLGAGHGHLRARLAEVHSAGRGSAARPRHARLWLPAADGGIAADQDVRVLSWRRAL
jgi:hypothetical protein